LELLALSKIVFIFILLCFSAFFSGAQTALFTLGAVKLKTAHHHRTSLVQELLNKPRRLLISILLGNMIITITASVVAASLCISLVGNRGIWVALLIMIPLILLCGEILPRTLAASHCEQWSLFVAQPLHIFIRALSPLRWIMQKTVTALTALFQNQNEHNQPILHEEELTEFYEGEPQDDAVLEKEEREMINRILAFSDTLVSTIMTPRSRMFILPADLEIAELIREVKENHFSRIPVYKQEKNTIVGVLYAKDLLALTRAKVTPSTMRDTLSRPPYFVPHDKKIPDLLKEFQDKQIHLALVVNEHGSVIGLVTMEDLLEVIFGEIYDEFDNELNTERTE
jgi:putative hemolysin